MNYPWGTQRRYNAYSDYFRIHFGERVQKVTIDAGFTCPNRDGTSETGGCTYCNNNAFNPSYCSPGKPISKQIEEGIEFHRKRYKRANKYLAYFQAYSNTYSALDKLKKTYEPALNHPQIKGIVIGTRPDCVDDEKLNYFKEINKSKYVVIEYGIESCYNRTLQMIKRGHTFEQSKEAVTKTAGYGIRTGAHFIFGLPGETIDEMMQEAQIIAQLPLHSIKFHQLQIIKDTRMALQFKEEPEKFSFFSLAEYIDFITEFIQYLPPQLIIERFTGEVPPRFLAAPGWGKIRNDQIIHLISKKLEEKNTYQGKLFKGS
jgi:hypothetical protein